MNIATRVATKAILHVSHFVKLRFLKISMEAMNDQIAKAEYSRDLSTRLRHPTFIQLSNFDRYSTLSFLLFDLIKHSYKPHSFM